MLFEHAAGYALFALRQAEEVSLLLPPGEESLLSLGTFLGLVRLVAFAPFRSAQRALENVNAVSEGEGEREGWALPPLPAPAELSSPPTAPPPGVLHEDLRLLLETNLPAKKKKVLLGVSDAKIGAAIQEELGYQCQTGGVIAEITRGRLRGLRQQQGGPAGRQLPARALQGFSRSSVVESPRAVMSLLMTTTCSRMRARRCLKHSCRRCLGRGGATDGGGATRLLWRNHQIKTGTFFFHPLPHFYSPGIRLHFPSLIKGLTAQSASKAQLGLGHSYSRAKVKFNVNRVDNMIIQSISLLDQLDKDINTFSMRVR